MFHGEEGESGEDSNSLNSAELRGWQNFDQAVVVEFLSQLAEQPIALGPIQSDNEPQSSDTTSTMSDASPFQDACDAKPWPVPSKRPFASPVTPSQPQPQQMEGLSSLPDSPCGSEQIELPRLYHSGRVSREHLSTYLIQPVIASGASTQLPLGSSVVSLMCSGDVVDESEEGNQTYLPCLG